MQVKIDESSQTFGRQVEARRFVDAVVAKMIEHELAEYAGTVEGWFLGGVTHEPTRRRITKAARALSQKLTKAARR